MAATECGRVEETIRAAWGEGGADEAGRLASHVASCPVCAEIAVLAEAFREDRQAACAAAHPPSAAVVWWRAQRRAREQASRRAERPIALVHAVSLGCAAAAASAFASLGAPRFWSWLTSLDLHVVTSRIAEATSGGWIPAWPVIAMLLLATSGVLAPVVVYLALTEK